jgi:hypothetical protein
LDSRDEILLIHSYDKPQYMRRDYCSKYYQKLLEVEDRERNNHHNYHIDK